MAKAPVLPVGEDGRGSAAQTAVIRGVACDRPVHTGQLIKINVTRSLEGKAKDPVRLNRIHCKTLSLIAGKERPVLFQTLAPAAAQQQLAGKAARTQGRRIEFLHELTVPRLMPA